MNTVARRSLLTLLCTAAAVPAAVAADAAQSPEEQRLRSDWPYLARYRDQNRELKTSGTRIDAVFLGDSITEGWLQKAPAFFNAGRICRGIGGQTTPQLLIRFRQDVIDLQPRAVHIMAGTNDIAGNTGPSTLKMIQDNFMGMTEIATANGVHLILASIPPASDFPWRPGVETVTPIAAMNAWIKDLAGFWRQVLLAIMAGAGQSVRVERDLSDDAVIVAAVSPQHPVARRWREYRGLLLFVLLMCSFRSAWADWVYVPTGSMNPTILEGDRLLIDKHVYGLRVPFSLLHLTRGANPDRGDIIVFDSPRDGTSLVKRVIALPGDSVALDGERLIVNGVAASYAAGQTAELQRLLRATRRQDPAVVRESGVLPGHDILLLPDRRNELLLGPVTVPQEMYFVLGDNRDNSADSRYIGFVPRRNIVGRATRVVLSLNPDRYYAPRSGRFFSPL